MNKKTAVWGPFRYSSWQLTSAPRRLHSLQVRAGDFGAALTWKQNTEHRTQHTDKPQQEATTRMPPQDKQGRSIWPGNHVSTHISRPGKPRVNGLVVALLEEEGEVMVRWPGASGAVPEKPEHLITYVPVTRHHDASNILLLAGDRVKIAKPGNEQVGKLRGKIIETGLANDRLRVKWDNGYTTTLRAALLLWTGRWDNGHGSYSSWTPSPAPARLTPDPVEEAENKARSTSEPARASDGDDDGEYLETSEMDCA